MGSGASRALHHLVLIWLVLGDAAAIRAAPGAEFLGDPVSVLPLRFCASSRPHVAARREPLLDIFCEIRGIRAAQRTG